jgi:branched-chain amino acid transport system substrate-binding protein
MKFGIASHRCLRLTLGAAIAAVALHSIPANAADVIKIGAPLALTGPLSVESKKQGEVYNMWVDKVNAQGGINVGGKKMNVKLIEYDYQSDGQRAAQLAEKLITDDKVDFLFAPFGSGHTKIVASVAERYQTPLIACSASAETVYDQGFKYLFGLLAANGASNAIIVNYIKSKAPGVRSVAIYGRDDVFPKSMASGVSEAAKSGGLQVVYSNYYSVGTIDHSSGLSAIKAAKPDWIYVTGYTDDLVLIRKQMSDLGVAAPIVTMVAGPAYREYTDALGNLANGITSWTWWHPAVNYKGVGVWPTTQSFVSDFIAKDHAEPDYIHASCAAAGEILANAIERAGTIDHQKVRDALASTNITTFYGPIKYAASGMNEAGTIPIIQIQDKKIKVLYPDDVKNGDLQLIK